MTFLKFLLLEIPLWPAHYLLLSRYISTHTHNSELALLMDHWGPSPALALLGGFDTPGYCLG